MYRLCCGTPYIAIDELKGNVVLDGFVQTDQTIQWFWACVSAFNDDERARLLQFITGSAQLPLGGCANLNPPLRITRDNGVDRLPSAHTCFNQLVLPYFSSQTLLDRFVFTAVTEGYVLRQKKTTTPPVFIQVSRALPTLTTVGVCTLFL